MAQTLRSAMLEILAGWRHDIDPVWRPVAAELALDFDAIDPTLTIEPWEPVFPVRRGRRLPGQPAGTHMLRCFDGIAPGDVRCVLLAQDPYPCTAFATGRAFEAGNVARWRELEKMFSCSFRTLLQMIVSEKTGDSSYARSTDDWARVIDEIEGGRLEVPSAAAMVDRWVAQGVLPLNSALTLSRFAVEGDPHQLRGHLPLWRPFVLAVLGSLARRPERPLVLLGFGAHAAGLLREAGLADGSHARTICIVRDHPAAGNAVLSMENPFTVGNDFLEGLGERRIDWGGVG